MFAANFSEDAAKCLTAKVGNMSAVTENFFWRRRGPLSHILQSAKSERSKYTPSRGLANDTYMCVISIYSARAVVITLHCNSSSAKIKHSSVGKASLYRLCLYRPE